MWAGVDVGGRRKGFHVALLDGDDVVGPFQARTPADVVAALLPRRARVVAIDSPRVAAPDGARSRPGERALASAVCGIRYTPERALLAGSAYYAWILHGFELYAALDAAGLHAIECFPTASLTRWAGRRGARTRAAWSSEALAAAGVPVPTSQDGRDAVAAALTARAYDEGAVDWFEELVVPVRSGDQNSSKLPSGS